MLPERLDTTLAFKAISLSDALTGTEKAVAAAIVDSFNRRTGQCDPSFDRIAHLTGKSRRTVIRAVQRLEGLKFLLKVRHGGLYHRNSYEPNWLHFRSLEAQWAGRKATRHWGPKMSPSTVPKLCHVGGDQVVTQTPLINPSRATCHQEEGKAPPADQSSVPGKSVKGNPRQETGRVARGAPWAPSRSASGPAWNNSAFAQRSAAERRWNTTLTQRLVGTPSLYAAVIDALDRDLQDKATAAEMRQRGQGLVCIVEELLKRGMVL